MGGGGTIWFVRKKETRQPNMRIQLGAVKDRGKGEEIERAGVDDDGGGGGGGEDERPPPRAREPPRTITMNNQSADTQHETTKLNLVRNGRSRSCILGNIHMEDYFSLYIYISL